MAGRGRLVLVVGPSGAGKDTLIEAARRQLASAQDIVFARRIVTREAVAALEDHDSLDPAAFEAAGSAGAFALAWEANGLRYALPASILDALAAGGTVVANVSRRAVAAAQALGYPVRVAHVTAPVALRAQRLTGRGREAAAEIAARLTREVAVEAAGAQVHEICNDGSIEDGARALIAIITDERETP